MSAADRAKITMRMNDLSPWQKDIGIDVVYAMEYDGYGTANKQITASTFPKVFAWVEGKYFDDDTLCGNRLNGESQQSSPWHPCSTQST
jgi:hypothetical protein